MKTYILDSLNKYKRFSESLDVSTTLCNKTWSVFNDTGDKELYIFKDDHEVIITSNGVGFKGKWEWIPTNKSLIISQQDSVLMLHPEYKDDVVLALVLDGTLKQVFLIDDNNRESFKPKTLAELESYFINMEAIALKKEEEKHRADMIVADNERIAQIKLDRERQKEIHEQQVMEEARVLKKQLSWDVPSWTLLFPVCLCIIFDYLIIADQRDDTVLEKIGCIILLDFIFVGLYIFLVSLHATGKQRENIEQWKKNHPDDERGKYLSYSN